MDNPTGTVVFTTFGRPHYGFDVFSTPLPPSLTDFSSSPESSPTELRLTDGVSVNFNAQFAGTDDNHRRIVYVSERTGSSKIYLDSDQLPSAPASLFHDRPIVKNGNLYFVSAHERPDSVFKSWSALYTVKLDGELAGELDGDETVTRLTPYGCVDYSPAVSQSGELIAVASYGSRIWSGEFHHMETDIVVFRRTDPDKRWIVCGQGGWPTFSGESTIYFHRQADDGWWSIFRLELPSGFDVPVPAPRRVTPPGVHCEIRRFKDVAFVQRTNVVLQFVESDREERDIHLNRTDFRFG